MGQNLSYTNFPFDFWSIIHFGFWAFVASTIAAKWEPKLKTHLIYGLIGSYIWEIAEFFASRKWPATWSFHLETWYNAFLGDPISNLLGVVFGWFVVYFYRHLYNKVK